MNLALQLFHLSRKVTASGRVKRLNIKLVYKGRNSGPVLVVAIQSEILNHKSTF